MKKVFIFGAFTVFACFLIGIYFVEEYGISGLRGGINTCCDPDSCSKKSDVKCECAHEHMTATDCDENYCFQWIEFYSECDTKTEGSACPLVYSETETESIVWIKEASSPLDCGSGGITTIEYGDCPVIKENDYRCLIDSCDGSWIDVSENAGTYTCDI